MAVFSQIGGISTGSIGNVLTGAGGPLASLFGGPGANILQYPQDLTNDPARMHWVQFTVFNVVPVDFQVQAQVNTAAASSSASSSESFLDKAKATLANAGKALFGNITNTNSPKAPGQVETIINLYMPDTLNVTYDNPYDELSLTEATGGVNKLVQGFQDLSSQYRQGESAKALGTDPKLIEAMSKQMSGDFAKLNWAQWF